MPELTLTEAKNLVESAKMLTAEGEGLAKVVMKYLFTLFEVRDCAGDLDNPKITAVT